MAESAKGKRRKGGDPRFALPSAREQDHLRQTDNLFRSNLLRLEIDELLKQVTVAFGEAKQQALKKLLFDTKAALEGAKAQDGVTPDKASGVKISKWDAVRSGTLDFRPPAAVDVVGSFMLETMCQPRRNVDLAVTMPDECFAQKDFRNHRYFDKRLLYLGVLAKALRKAKLFADVALTGFAGDTSKPVLTARPKQGSGLEGVAVRVIPTVSESVFPMSRFRPGNGNVRPLDHFEFAGSQADREAATTPATPSYNMAVLEDMAPCGPKRLLQLLHELRKESKSFRSVCVLVKVWCRVRGLTPEVTPDGFCERHMEYLLAHLLLERQLNASMSVQQMFRSLITYVAETDLASPDCVMRMRPSFRGGAAVIEEGFHDEALTAAFPVRLVGPCGKLNLAWRVTEQGWRATQRHAQTSAALLANAGSAGGKDAFAALFVTKFDHWQQYDKFYTVPVPRKLSKAQPADLVAKLCDLPREAALRQHLAFVAKRALVDTGRVKEARIITNAGECREWALGEKAPMHSAVLVCVRIDLQQAFRRLDKGPSAADTAASKAFRDFWGELSELRRYRDGTILETLDWAQGEAGKLPGDTCDRVFQHVLGRHWWQHTKSGAAPPGVNVIVGHELEQSLSVLDDQLAARNGAAGEGGFEELLGVFDGLSKRLRELDLPLSVIGVAASDPALRFTSATQPVPHPLAFGAAQKGLQAGRPAQHKTKAGKRGIESAGGPNKRARTQPARVSRLIDAVDVVLELESSGQWPEDPDAIENMKTAFYVQIAEQFGKAHPGEQRCIAAKHCVEVLTAGYAFRLRIRLDKERQLLSTPQLYFQGSVSRAAASKMRALNAGERDAAAAEARDLAKALRLEADTVRRPLLHQQLRALHTSTDKHGGGHIMGPVARLAKLWVSGHAMWPHLREEAIELLVASLFLHPQPYEAPRSAASGFLRFLHLLATWDWENEPLLVEMGGPGASGSAARGDLLREFLEARKRASGSHMYLVTCEDAERGWQPYWTDRDAPSSPALERIRKLAKESLGLVEKLLSLQASGEYEDEAMRKLWLAAFKSSASDDFLDAQVRLLPAQTLQSLGLSSETSATVYKNLRHEEKVFVGVRPIASLAEDIVAHFGRLFEVYYDPFRGRSVGLRWREGLTRPVPMRVAASDHSMPVPAKNKKGAPQLLPNASEVFADIVHLGAGLVERIDLCGGQP